MAEEILIDGVKLHLCSPDRLRCHWVGQQDALEQLLAAWLVVDRDDQPLHPRLLGRPGVGKTTLACAAAQAMERDVYIFQCTMDTRPEDLLVTPVLDASGGIRYVASPLVSAMITGGACILDEGNRMSEKAWASLAALLDSRRYIESIVAGLKVQADPEFRLCTTMNEDASTFDVPEYIHSRLQPQIQIDFAEEAEERRILKENLPFADDWIVEYVTGFLQRAHQADEPYSVRDGITIARYATKRMQLLGARADSKSLLRQAICMTLGDEAMMY